MISRVGLFNEFKAVRIDESFRAEDMDKVLLQIKAYLEHKIGKLYLLPGSEVIQKGSDILMGLHYITDTFVGLRFNWMKQLGGVQEIHSIDFFDKNTSLDPVSTLVLNGESIAKILPAVVQIFQNPKKQINVDDYYDMNESKSDNLEFIIYEKYVRVRTREQIAAEAAAKRSVRDKEKAERRARMEKARAEKNLTPSHKIAEVALSNVEYADADTIFEDMEGFITLVVKGIQSSLIISGLPGLGKCVGEDVYLDIKVEDDLYNKYTEWNKNITL